MNLENQACSKVQAKKIDELLGEHAPESLWVWARNDDGWSIKPKYYREPQSLMGGYVEFINAYSCAELGVMLPESVIFKEVTLFCQMDRQINKYKFLYNRPFSVSRKYSIHGNIFSIEAHAKADLLTQLREEKIIKSEDVKL